MQELCDYMLTWFMSMYEKKDHQMSPEVYDRAVFVVGVGVPMLLYTAVVVSFVFSMAAAFDWARGRRK